MKKLKQQKRTDSSRKYAEQEKLVVTEEDIADVVSQMDSDPGEKADGIRES